MSQIVMGDIAARNCWFRSTYDRRYNIDASEEYWRLFLSGVTSVFGARALIWVGWVCVARYVQRLYVIYIVTVYLEYCFHIFLCVLEFLVVQVNLVCVRSCESASMKRFAEVLNLPTLNPYWQFTRNNDLPTNSYIGANSETELTAFLASASDKSWFRQKG